MADLEEKVDLLGPIKPDYKGIIAEDIREALRKGQERKDAARDYMIPRSCGRRVLYR